MRIERISENQVKFILNQSDLMERNIRLNELSYGSEKTQELFREMMEQALMECDFRAEQDTPLIIEAIPLADESIVIIVTKTKPDEAEERKSNLLNSLRDIRRRAEAESRSLQESAAPEGSDMIFAFKTFDDAAALADRVFGQFCGKSALYRADKTYYLALDARALNPRERQEMEFVLMEYARKVPAAALSRLYLDEHGEALMPANALALLWEYYNA